MDDLERFVAEQLASDPVFAAEYRRLGAINMQNPLTPEQQAEVKAILAAHEDYWRAKVAEWQGKENHVISSTVAYMMAAEIASIRQDMGIDP